MAVLRSKRQAGANNASGNSPKLPTVVDLRYSVDPEKMNTLTSLAAAAPNFNEVFLGFSTVLTKIRNSKLYRRKFSIPDDQSCLR
jgi:hypothetical protein